MAFKLALLTFEFDRLIVDKGTASESTLEYNPELEHNFDKYNTLPGEGCQPVVAEAVSLIKLALIKRISSMFNFANLKLLNLSNLLHVATLTTNIQVMHTDGSQEGQQCILVVLKFYRLEPRTRYKVCIDLEEMPSSAIDATSMDEAFKLGISNKQVEEFVCQLEEYFCLEKGSTEFLPIIRRGRLDKPHFLVTSDERILEYDFDKLLFHKQSEFQDIKIVSSPSLGNTLLLDNSQNLAEVDLPYTYALMNRGNVSYTNKEILILGGGDGGLLWELLKEDPKFVTMAEIDATVLEACSCHLKPFGKLLNKLEDSNYKIIIDDCLKVLRKSVDEGKKYDFIFNDLTDIPVCQRKDALTAFDSSAVQTDSPWHFIETIFNLSLDCLAEDGVYMNHASGKGNREAIESYEDFLRNSRVQLEYESRESYVPSFMEIWTFYSIKRKTKQV